MIHAEDLSPNALLAGLRAGRVFIDLDGTRDPMLDLTAKATRSHQSDRLNVRDAAGRLLLIGNPVYLRIA